MSGGIQVEISDRIWIEILNWNLIEFPTFRCCHWWLAAKSPHSNWVWLENGKCGIRVEWKVLRCRWRWGWRWSRRIIGDFSMDNNGEIKIYYEKKGRLRKSVEEENEKRRRIWFQIQSKSPKSNGTIYHCLCCCFRRQFHEKSQQ